ncbi:MAG: hypothetical protein A3F41_03250 [Coxiella sp. RIFCSPHIGHO2_12_FULL_44_14]|nr:MAG: hypothetical protein A3F41_03250 [Coxiella sp. RIFCSPHIGHO2_12_FULL_44_14]
MSTVLKRIVDQLGPYFYQLAEKSQDVFWIKSADFQQQLYVSPSYERIWGRSCQSLYRRSADWLNTVILEDRDRVRQKLMEWQVNARVDETLELRYRILDQTGVIHWIETWGFSIHENEQCIGYAGIAYDITQIMKEADVENQLREQWREAKDHAEKANRAKSDFLAMMSHELRTPLNAILGMAQILKTSSLTEEQRDQLDVIAQSGQHLLILLNDLLDFAKLEVGQLSFTDEPFQLDILVSSLVRDMSLEAHNKGIELILHQTHDVPDRLIGDAKRVRQILANLLSNAIKFTEKGHVQLKIHCLQKNLKDISLCFTVEDTGIGIEQAKLDTIFSRFQHRDSVYQRKHEGMGLGLSIVKELVEKMQGSTVVSSELGMGSQFSCIIPFRLQGVISPVVGSFSEPPSMQSASNEREVLVVEDNLINQKISKMLLEQLGCRVDVASSSQEALEKIKHTYEMIFMDIGLPDRDGFETVELIRQQEAPGWRVPIIAMTAHVLAQDRQRCFEAGMDEVMTKPIMQTDLMAVLQRWSSPIQQRQKG